MLSFTTLHRTAGAAPAVVRTLVLSKCTAASAAAVLTARQSKFSPAPSLQPQHQHQQRRGYHENIIEHYENPRNVGSLDKNDDDVGTVCVEFYVFVSL